MGGAIPLLPPVCSHDYFTNFRYVTRLLLLHRLPPSLSFCDMQSTLMIHQGDVAASAVQGVYIDNNRTVCCKENMSCVSRATGGWREVVGPQ